MTRFLSKMVEPFNDNFEFQSSIVFHLINEAKGHVLDLTQMEIDESFKKEIEGNISFIPKERPIIERLNTFGGERLETIGGDVIDSNYGLRIGAKVIESRAVDKNMKKVSTKKSRIVFQK